MTLNFLLEKLINEFQADLRNSIFVNEEILIASATEETDCKVTDASLHEAISSFLSGDMTEQQESIYDGAVYSCGVVARTCLNNNSEVEVDYEINWILNNDGSYTAEEKLC